jgi:hypothetical protein
VGAKLPIYRDHLLVENVPWDTINQYLDESESIPPLIENEFIGNAVTTIQLKKRLDLDPWAHAYRQKVMEIVNKLMPTSESYDYVSQEHGAWFNRYREGGSANWHHHGSFVDFVVVWYLQAEPGMGGFILKYNDQDHVVPVSTGDILVFPGTLIHSSESNSTKKERYLMSNNICITRRSKLDKAAKNQLYLQRQSRLYNLIEQL